MSSLSMKNSGIAVDECGATCGQCELSYTQENVVVFALFTRTWFIHSLMRDVCAALYTRLDAFSDQLGGAFYTLSTTPITTTTY